jgi:hypothetical protein
MSHAPIGGHARCGLAGTLSDNLREELFVNRHFIFTLTTGSHVKLLNNDFQADADASLIVNFLSEAKCVPQILKLIFGE